MFNFFFQLHYKSIVSIVLSSVLRHEEKSFRFNKSSVERNVENFVNSPNKIKLQVFNYSFDFI